MKRRESQVFVSSYIQILSDPCHDVGLSSTLDPGPNPGPDLVLGLGPDPLRRHVSGQSFTSSSSSAGTFGGDQKKSAFKHKYAC